MNHPMGSKTTTACRNPPFGWKEQQHWPDCRHSGNQPVGRRLEMILSIEILLGASYRQHGWFPTWMIYTVVWVKLWVKQQCHWPAMSCNGNHTISKAFMILVILEECFTLVLPRSILLNEEQNLWWVPLRLKSSPTATYLNVPWSQEFKGLSRHGGWISSLGISD